MIIEVYEVVDTDEKLDALIAQIKDCDKNNIKAQVVIKYWGTKNRHVLPRIELLQKYQQQCEYYREEQGGNWDPSKPGRVGCVDIHTFQHR